MEVPDVTRLDPTEVECEVAIVRAEDGESLIQLTTFGSPERISDRKPSQKIQLTRDAFNQLVEFVGELRSK
ncbi:hypothetical protein Y710_18310 [Gordonia sp. QH-12]|nr:hypothetical protein Y710_18310 [Gordonia sp. QH-12]